MRNSNPNNSNILALLTDIQKKLDHTVFNGGFETLLKNVESIEASQKELVNQFRELNEVIYEPDTGLFSRIKKAETLYADEIKELQRSVKDLTDWKKDLDGPEGTIDSFRSVSSNVNHIVEWKKTLDEPGGVIETYQEVGDIKEWKKNVMRIIWGFGSAAGLMLLKTVYDFLVNHVVIR